MKTFEERYTAWIDGGLKGNALGAFEQELARRSAAAEAQADKADAGRLRLLLQEHLQAPSLTNAEFFSLQIRERIDAERAASRRSPSAPGASWTAWLAWPVARLAGLGAACLFVAGALYYGMIPPHTGGPAAAVVAESTGVSHGTGAPVAVAETKPAAAASTAPTGPRSGDNLMAKNDTPDPEDAIDDVTPDLAASVPDSGQTSTTATPLHYKDGNVNVLWINGLDYMPAVPEAAPAPVTSPAPAPADVHHG